MKRILILIGLCGILWACDKEPQESTQTGATKGTESTVQRGLVRVVASAGTEGDKSVQNRSEVANELITAAMEIEAAAFHAEGPERTELLMSALAKFGDAYRLKPDDKRVIEALKNIITYPEIKVYKMRLDGLIFESLRLRDVGMIKQLFKQLAIVDPLHINPDDPPLNSPTPEIVVVQVGVESEEE